MRKADRLFQIVNLVRAHQPISAANLAKRLNVSVRTIYRYIDDISASGIPIYGETGLGYALLQDFELPPLSLTCNEMEALILSVSMLSRSVGDQCSAAAQSLLAKIQAASPSIPHIHTPLIARSLAARPIHLGDWDTLHKAIQMRHTYRITYQSITGDRSVRVILPLGLFYWGGKWTVGTWCFLRNAFREFRLDLIEQITPTKQTVEISDDITLDKYLQYQATQ